MRAADSRRRQLIQRLCSWMDPRLSPPFSEQLESAFAAARVPLAPGRRWVLAGHRAAGKSTLLPLLCELGGRPGVDLDARLEEEARRSIRGWYSQDPAGFRAAERACFAALPQECLVAVGGGFLSLHQDLLTEAEVILIPLTFETYRERLVRSRTRPRLRPELPEEEELRQVFHEREALHRQLRTHPLAQAVAAMSEAADERA